MWSGIIAVLGFIRDSVLGIFKSNKPIETSTTSKEPSVVKANSLPLKCPECQGPLTTGDRQCFWCGVTLKLCVVFVLCMQLGCSPVTANFGPVNKDNTTFIRSTTKIGEVVQELRCVENELVWAVYTDIVKGEKVGRRSKIQIQDMVLVRPDIAIARGIDTYAPRVEFSYTVEGFPLPQIPGRKTVQLNVGGWYITTGEQ